MNFWKHDGKLVMTERGHYVGTACSDVSANCFVRRHNHEVEQEEKRQRSEWKAPNRDNW